MIPAAYVQGRDGADLVAQFIYEIVDYKAVLFDCDVIAGVKQTYEVFRGVTPNTKRNRDDRFNDDPCMQCFLGELGDYRQDMYDDEGLRFSYEPSPDLDLITNKFLPHGQISREPLSR